MPHQKHKSVECLTWNVLSLGMQSTRRLFACIGKEFICQCGCKGKHTLNAMYEVMLWSFMVMMEGQFPRCRHNGDPWAKQPKSIKEINKKKTW